MDIPAKPWTGKTAPGRILAIRLQAMGDVVLSLPYLQDLRNNLPSSTTLDFLTLEETAGIPRSIELFNTVFSIGGGRSFKKQLLHTVLMLPRLLAQRYDVIIDLQHNRISGIVLKTLMPRAWVLFDRFSPIPAGERNRLTIEAVGLGSNQLNGRFRLKDPRAGERVLRNHGWNGKDALVVLNPAGAFETRHWKREHYVAFARLWMEVFPDARFLVLGTSFIAGKAAFLQEQLGERLINLVGKTTPWEAFAVLQHAQLMLSEDSGLMHMAWTSGIPTLALLGSTRSDWSRPLGEHSVCLDSSDLPCGNCMQAVCAFGDVHCLTRRTPGEVFEHAIVLIRKMQNKQA